MLAATIASLGLYTYFVPVMATGAMGSVDNITPYLWAWGIGGVLGSVLVGSLVDKVRRPATLVVGILAILALRCSPSGSPPPSPRCSR